MGTELKTANCSPDSMACNFTNEGIYQVAAVIYNSLAKCYADTVREIEQIEHVTYPCINIVGGGANAAYLNELTAKATGKTVYAGPTEATAIGNIMAQMIAAGELQDLVEARKCVFLSFEILGGIYEEKAMGIWNGFVSGAGIAGVWKVRWHRG